MAPDSKENDYTALLDFAPGHFVPKASPRKYEIKYFNVFLFGTIYLTGFYGMYLAITCAKWATVVMTLLFYVASQLGITAGVHRLWSHNSYKAKTPLEIILLICNSIAYHNTATDWVLKHRMHHKYTDTDGDPHNAFRGFFYSHIGWLLVKRHPDVKTREKNIDMTDVYNNEYLKFQKKYAIPMFGFFCFFLPTAIPIIFWEESFKNAYFVNLFRWALSLNSAFMVNSVAHIWGYKPYDKQILATENQLVNIFNIGEGSHNFHHVFPWDYRCHEFGLTMINLTALFIEFFAYIGWAYDLRTTPEEMIIKRAIRTGDGSRFWAKDGLNDNNNYNVE